MLSNENEQVLEKTKRLVNSWRDQGVMNWELNVVGDDTIYTLNLRGIVGDVEIKVNHNTKEVEVLGRTGWDAVEVLEYLDENIKRQ